MTDDEPALTWAEEAQSDHTRMTGRDISTGVVAVEICVCVAGLGLAAAVVAWL